MIFVTEMITTDMELVEVGMTIIVEQRAPGDHFSTMEEITTTDLMIMVDMVPGMIVTM